MDFIKSHFGKMEPQVPFCDEKSVQLVRVASSRSNFLQNPYFNGVWPNFLVWSPPWVYASSVKNRFVIIGLDTDAMACLLSNFI